MWAVAISIGLGLAPGPRAVAQVPASAALVCRPAAKQLCTAKGCSPVALGTFGLLDLVRSTYSRCDHNGCDTYDAQMSKAGAFTTVDVLGRGLVVKVGDDGSYVEVATLGTIVYVSHGSCAPGT